MLAIKLIPHLLCWALILLVLLRALSFRRATALAAASAGFFAGAAAMPLLSGAVSQNLLFAGVRSALGGLFFLLWGISVAAIYRATGRRGIPPPGKNGLENPVLAALAPAVAGVMAGAICGCRIAGREQALLPLALLLVAAALLAAAANLLERRLPEALRVSPAGMLAAVVALLLCSSSSLLRLDLFSPLSMKVMKGVHDFVHQFMESILTPDHVFVQPVVWKFIGHLFSKEVGFWGGIVIWFTPAILIALAVRLQRLPSVAQIRQGAQRRTVLAAAIAARRSLLVAPLFSFAVLGAAAYQSNHPAVEYWDPKPLPVNASAAGEIFIPRKGAIDLEDGQLHKYLFKQGEREARFFVVMTPDGRLTVDLDACAICKPDGYGQAEGSVICYYCSTLIPLETIGKVGGCNPVPVRFVQRKDGVVIDAMTLVNTWTTTVQATTRGKGVGK